MPDKIAQFLQALDNADDYETAFFDDLEQDRLEEVDDLHTKDTNRDEALWGRLGVSAALVVTDYEEIEPDDRDLDWVMGLSGLSSAAAIQYYLDKREETLIKPLAYREQVLDAIELTSEEMILAGKRSTEFEAVQTFQKLQSKYVNELRFLREMDNTELYDYLREYGALRPTEQVIADSAQYVTRMTQYRPGSNEWKSAVNDLIDPNSKRAVQGMNRRSVQRLYTFRESGGDFNKLMVWIGEGDPNTCDPCFDRFGEVKTYGEWLEAGMPGASVCRGGDRDRCQLMALER